MEASKLKVLVYGDTWVMSLGKHHDSLNLTNLIIHYEGRLNAQIDYLITDLPNVLKEEYNHMMLFTLLSELYLNEKFSDKNGNEFWVKYPNLSFSLEKIMPKIEIFIKKCEELCPNISVCLMVPPPLDLNHYNTLQLRDAPAEVKKAYSQNSKYKPFEIMNHTLDLGKQLKQINHPETCYKIQSFSILSAVNDIQISVIKNSILSYVRRKSNTMGQNSYLIDGFHPSNVLISIMWRLFVDNKKLVSKKRNLPQSPTPPVLKVSPLKKGAESKTEKENKSTKVTLEIEKAQESGNRASSSSSSSSSSCTLSFPTTNKKPKLSNDAAEFQSFVKSETERFLYRLYGYASGKNLNYSTEEVALYISKYLVNRK